MMKLAPVALIAYNRSKTLLKTIESLKKINLLKILIFTYSVMDLGKIKKIEKN